MSAMFDDIRKVKDTGAFSLWKQVQKVPSMNIYLFGEGGPTGPNVVCPLVSINVENSCPPSSDCI